MYGMTEEQLKQIVLNEELINELIENYTWRPLSSEVIPFVSWLISKLDKKELSEVLQNQFEKVIKK
jgi:hypothetical protein